MTRVCGGPQYNGNRSIIGSWKTSFGATGIVFPYNLFFKNYGVPKQKLAEMCQAMLIDIFEKLQFVYVIKYLFVT